MNVFSKFPIAILSPDVPFKVRLFASMSCPSISLKDTTIKICIPEPAFKLSDNVLEFVEKQRQTIIDEINCFETKTFKVVSSAKDAEFTFVTNSLTRKHKGKIVRFLRIKWVMTKNTKQIQRNALQIMRGKQIKISAINLSDGRKARRRVGQFSEILEAPGFQTAVAYHLIFKNMIS